MGNLAAMGCTIAAACALSSDHSVVRNVAWARGNIKNANISTFSTVGLVDISYSVGLNGVERDVLLSSNGQSIDSGYYSWDHPSICSVSNFSNYCEYCKAAA